MQIAVTPDPYLWVVVPEFPAPGWAKAEARARSQQLDITGPQWRAEFVRLLEGLRRTERIDPLARLLHLGDGAQYVFAVDIGLEPTQDDGTREGRRATQQELVAEIIPGAHPQRLRPSSGTAGFWAVAPEATPSHPYSPGAVVVLRRSGLPIVPVDIVMRVWGAPPSEIIPVIGHVIDLADAVAPAE